MTQPTPSPPRPEFRDNGITAHRGNAWDFPENTMSAVTSAAELGADWVEIDVRRTRDAQLVVIHDADTWRVGVEGADVGASSYWRLRKIDVAGVFRRRRRLSVDQCPPACIPLLEEVLAVIKTQHHARLSLHPKDVPVQDVVDMIQWTGATAWAGVNHSDLSLLAQARQREPAIRTFWDRPADAIWAEDVPLAVEAGVDAVILHHSAATPDGVRAIREAGLEAGARTVNDVQEMRRLLEMGVQRIYTDCPGRAMLLKESLAPPEP